MPLAFSYLRFSSREQAKGDSIRRQTEAAQKWADQNAAQLDESLSLRDEGVSAHKGRHRENPDIHGLARFLDAVNTGRVPKGSYLLVENLDRLSREDIGRAVELLLSLVNRGIIVVQLSPIATEFRDPIDMGKLWLAVGELYRGNSESAMKSMRAGAAWEKKRKEAGDKVLTRRVPAWIRFNNGTLTLDRQAAEIIRRIFAMAREGLGPMSIANQFNDERVQLFGRKVFKGRAVRWSQSLIHSILNSRATIGEYQPCKGAGSERQPCGEPILNYYPAVIDADFFHSTQSVLRARAKVSRGRRGAHVNLFAGLLVDVRNGGPAR
jgi:DNA invertase Pin-like site-specific DNA recombinase